MKKLFVSLQKNLKSNLKSGLTVAVVSIPLSLSLAIASGLSPAQGILTTVWVGLIVALLGGSDFTILGPTGTVSGIVLTFALVHGASAVPLLTAAAGVFVLLAYILHLERYIILIPSSVIHGFTLGIACILGIGQLGDAFGLAKTDSLSVLVQNSDMSHILTFLVFSIFLAGLLFFKKYTPRLPGVIFLAPLGILLGYLSTMGYVPLCIKTLGGCFGEVSFFLFNFSTPSFTPDIIKTAIIIALMLILETMLSARVADTMTHTKHDERKEIFALGLANIVAGIFGGMPAPAVLARTSLNIKSGATGKSSALFSVFFVVIISFLFLKFFTYMPMPVIAAVLFFVAIQMIEREHFAELFAFDRSGFYLSLGVALTTLFEGPVIGILVGVAISLLIIINTISRGQFDLEINRKGEIVVGTLSGDKVKEVPHGDDILLYSIKGKLCYLNSRAHVARFEKQLFDYKNIIIRLREVYFMDLDGVKALDEIIDILESRQQRVFLVCIRPEIIKLLEGALEHYPKLKNKGRVVPSADDALKLLGVKP